MRRRDLFKTAALVAAGAAGAAVGGSRSAEAVEPSAGGWVPVVTPNGSTMPYRVENGVKVFHIVAEPVMREFTPGLKVQCWGYNGQTPGPTIEAVEGDRVRMVVTNRLPEQTTIHWHGVLLPFGMDGVSGLTQKPIMPGETYVYEFTLRQHGTLMYHPHADEMTQIAQGMMGFFVIHPKVPTGPRVDRDFAIFLAEWKIPPGTSRPDPFEMTEYNYFTFNSRVFPGTAPLVVKRGQRVRVRLANLSMDSHPVHLHGHVFHITGTPGGRIPQGAWVPEATVNVPVGTTRDFEFVADNPGDWPLHCHKVHHTMNGMAHNLPNMIGVKQTGKVAKVVPGYMPMGENGMAEMEDMDMGRPANTVPMGSAPGPFGTIGMGGMFTLI
ncbi:MAG: copper oxidase, partial [Proteobacteria bacterium]|nr:copper oxidase [Pseudomonadota bacterium]